MQQLIYLARKAVLRCWAVCLHPLHNWYARWLLYAGNAVYGPGLCSFGIPDVRISRGNRRRSVPCRIGREFTMRNGPHGVSRSSQRCLISVDRDGVHRVFLADGDALVVSGVDTTGLAGSLSWNPDGSLLFTPTAGFAGSTGFSYQVADGNGGLDTGHVRIEVLPETTTTPIGNAPVRESGLGGQWTAAWTHTGITTLHQHDATNAAEAWTPVAYHAISTSQLAGGDMYGGDLGVSGQSVATSSVRQEIDGSEALRFELATEATGVTVNLSRFFINDDGSLFAESGRLRLLDDSGAVVAETTFQASNAAGTQAVSLGWQDGFSAVELSAGAWDGTDFVFGAYDGGAPIATDAAGKPHGSDFLVDWVEFDFPVVGVPLPPNEV